MRPLKNLYRKGEPKESAVFDISTLVSLVFAALGLLYWTAQLVILIRVDRRVPRLDQLSEEEREDWPRVSVIITACNEEAGLEAAVRDRLAEDYPELEFVLVEDRSTDGTPEIARRLAQEDPRIKLEQITELPHGWLGKPYALQRGLERATGQWLVFSDGDVSVHRGALRRLVALCERRGIDHCAVIPRLRPVSPLLDSLTSAFLRLVALNLRIWAIEDPRQSAAVGIGAFNLVRRSALERSPGFEWLRMEVADDLCLGQMLKAAGARQSVVNGREYLDVQFHSSVKDSLRSAERATYTAIGNFSILRLAAMALVVLALELSPLMSLALASAPAALIPGGFLLAIAVAAMVVSNRFNGRPSGNLVLFPVAELLVAYSMLRSGVLGTLRGGIVWRGTFYPNEQLKAGRRFGSAWKMLAGLRSDS